MRLSEWPGFRVVMIFVSWILLVFIVAAWRAYWRLTQVPEDGVAAVSFGLTTPALIAFGPPLLLGVAWVLVRRRAR